jgi:hypothetical protein
VIGTNSRLVERLEPGDYCVSVRGFAGAAGEFAVSVAMPGEGPDLGAGSGGSFGGAADPMACTAPGTVDLVAGLVPGFAATALPGVVMTEGPADYRMSVSAPVDLQLDAASDNIDTVLALYAADGTLLNENDDDFEAGGTNSRIVTALDPGSYCLRVRSFGGESGPFTVAVAAPGSAGPGTGGGAIAREPLTLPEAPEELGVVAGEPLQSKAISRDKVLWASFQVESAGMVAVQGVSMTSDFTLVLLAEDGTELAAEPGRGDVATARIETDLPAGRYFVALDNAWDDPVLQVRQITVSRP